MAITRYYVETRPNTSVAFPTENSALTHMASVNSLIQACVAAGNLTYTVDVSSDGLTQTRSRSVGSLDIFNSVEQMLRSFDVVKEVQLYNQTNGLTGTGNLTGIDQPFTVTTTYTLSNTVGISSLADIVAAGVRRSLTNISVGTDTITTVHNFANCEEFNANMLSASTEVNMFTGAVIKTQAFALV